jgi:hypothetical protein
MPRTAGCPQGHLWEIPDETPSLGAGVCPVCGIEAVSLAAKTATSPGEGITAEFPAAPEDAAPAGPLPSFEVPGFEVLGELGKGGMGVVYKARQAGLGRVVALKVIRAGAFASAEERARFQAEARTAAALQHPGIVRIYAVGEHAGCPYFAMEHAPAGTLAGRLRGGPLPPREAAALVSRLARAVHHAHRASVVHRDLKPANVLLTEDGGVKVADFGLARHLAGGAGLTRGGAVLGTPGYMAPEQAGGNSRDAGPAADVYALGAILYECLTGRPPFKGATALDTLWQVRSRPPRPPRKLRPEVPPALEAVCLCCLEKVPEARYPDADALADDLDRVLAALPAEPPPRRRRARWLALGGLGLALGLAAALLIYFRSDESPNAAPPPDTDPLADADVPPEVHFPWAGRPAEDAEKAGPDTNQIPRRAAADVEQVVQVINDSLRAGWKKNKVTPSRYADDYSFIRRASLDVIGRIARPEEIRKYLADPPDRRRALLIDRLLASPEYARHWADVWSGWLLGRSGPFGRGTYREQMTAWLEHQFTQNRKYHEIVKDLLTAEGDNTKNGAVNFILAHVGQEAPLARRAEEGQFDMVPLTARVTRLFLGVKAECAQCHDHPFAAAIKQQEFWGVNAFLRQVVRDGKPSSSDRPNKAPLFLRDNPEAVKKGIVFYEARNGVVRAARAEFLLGGGPPVKGLDPARVGVARRADLAAWLIEHDKFPTALVNRMWGVFFGKGFVNPVGDFNDTNEPANPELLKELSARFKESGYDLKQLIRWTCTSEAYQLGWVANRTNDRPEHEVLFGRMPMRPLSPEQTFASLLVATGVEVPDREDVRKAVREAWLSALVGDVGDDEGNEVDFHGSMTQALMMMNDQGLNEAIAHKDRGTVARAMGRGRTPAQVITELYLAALNRPPTPRELQAIRQRIELASSVGAADPQMAARYEDLFWALLNSNEFQLQH